MQDLIDIHNGVLISENIKLQVTDS